MISQPSLSAKSPTIRRILREAQELSNAPSPDYTAVPLESDLFEWHFTIKGPPNSVYSEGIYHGRIVLPPTYPLRPPSFRFVTPSGRFEANREICLSISGHHEETWQPAWGIRTALVALRSFMETDPKGQLGGLESSDGVRRRLATESQAFRCIVCGKTNSEIMIDSTRAVESSSVTEKVVAIPPELKMGWRDEIEKGGSSMTGPSISDSLDGANPGNTTGPAPSRVASMRSNLTSDAGSITPTEHDEIQRMASITHAQEHRSPHSQQDQMARRSTPAETIPSWVDRTILVLVVVIAATLAKLLLSS